ncbi:hypothetical protein L1049_019504 [Liquidambar formosana]|uniref:Uncharacterized protein n=1 Tax=Liquidambar formosana TaxID=63359 RepID=A0AAP0SBU0_LIQFO
MPKRVFLAITCKNGSNERLKYKKSGECKKIEGTVVLMKKNVLGLTSLHAAALDWVLWCN